MVDPEVLTDMTECAARVIELFNSATHTIYYSAFVCQTDASLPGHPGVTMHKLTSAAVERGVAVKMFFNPSLQYGNECLTNLHIDSRVDVCSISGDGNVPEPFNHIFGDRYSNHHQKFLIVDDQVVMIGGVGVHPCRAGWLTLNTESPAYYWHEVGVVTSCNPAFSTWVQNLWNNRFTHPPLPLMSGPTEHASMVELIRTAETCIHMEAQLCISTNSTENQILSTVVARLARAFHTPGDEFRFIMLVNTHQPDEHVVVSSVTTSTLHWSRRMLHSLALDAGMSPLFLNERVFIGTLEYEGTHIKVHSNLLIKDGHTMIRSSSNLTDRSLSRNPCDNELGVVISGDAVAVAQQKLWKQYFGMHPLVADMVPSEAFRYMTEETGFVKRVKYHKTFDSAFLPDFIVDFTMRAIHKLPFFGGQNPISWITTRVNKKNN